MWGISFSIFYTLFPSTSPKHSERHRVLLIKTKAYALYFELTNYYIRYFGGNPGGENTPMCYLSPQHSWNLRYFMAPQVSGRCSHFTIHCNVYPWAGPCESRLISARSPEIMNSAEIRGQNPINMAITTLLVTTTTSDHTFLAGTKGFPKMIRDKYIRLLAS